MLSNLKAQLKRGSTTGMAHDFEMRESRLRDPSGLLARAILPFSQKLSGGSGTREQTFRAAFLVVQALLRRLHTRMPAQCGRRNQIQPLRTVGQI